MALGSLDFIGPAAMSEEDILVWHVLFSETNLELHDSCIVFQLFINKSSFKFFVLEQRSLIEI